MQDMKHMLLTHSEIQQLKLLKRISPSERFHLMAQLIDNQIEAMKAGIKFLKPNINKRELIRCLRKRMKQMYSLKL